MKKAQSAMEYLMTYGWAILIVIIVAAALFALGVFSPSTYTGHQATGFGELGTPADWQYSDTDLTIILRNQIGNDVSISNVTSAGCTGGLAAPVTLPSSDTVQVVVDGCPDKNAPATYSQQVTVTYTVGAAGLLRTASGTLTGTAV
jgi:hypothetical protein